VGVYRRCDGALPAGCLRLIRRKGPVCPNEAGRPEAAGPSSGGNNCPEVWVVGFSVTALTLRSPSGALSSAYKFHPFQGVKPCRRGRFEEGYPSPLSQTALGDMADSTETDSSEEKDPDWQNTLIRVYLFVCRH